MALPQAQKWNVYLEPDAVVEFVSQQIGKRGGTNINHLPGHRLIEADFVFNPNLTDIVGVKFYRLAP